MAVVQTTELDPITGLPYKTRPIVDNTISAFQTMRRNPSLTPTLSDPNTQLAGYVDYFGSNQIPSGISMDDTRAHLQSGFAQLRNGFGKMLGIAAATTVDGIAGTVAGVANAAETAIEGGSMREVGNAFISNPVSNKLYEFQQKLEEWMPNYYTDEETSSNNIFKGFIPGTEGSANFWGDKFLKNLGFTLGMVIDGAITGGVANALLGTNRTALKLGKYIAATLDDGTDPLKVVNALKKGEISLSQFDDAIVKGARSVRQKTLGTQFAAGVLSAQGEARFEALNGMDEFKKSRMASLEEELANNYKSLVESGKSPRDAEQIVGRERIRKEQEINAATEAMGNAVFGLNVALLSSSNLMQFRNTFTNSFAFNRANLSKFMKGDINAGNLAEVGKDVVGDFGKYAGKKTGKLATAGIVAKNFGNALTEGFEEGAQQAIQSGSDYYYKSRLNPQSNKDAASLVQSAIYGMEQGFGTKMGLEQVFIGFLTGALGTPAPSSRSKIGVEWAGGIAKDIREGLKASKESNKVAEKLNSAAATITQENVKKWALIKGSEFDYKNADHAQFFNTVKTFADAGKLDDLIEQMEGMSSIKGEEIRQTLIQQDKSDPNINKTDAQLEQLAKDKTTKLINRAKHIAQIREDVATLFPGVSDEIKDELSYQSATIHDVDNRIRNLASEIGKTSEITITPSELKNTEVRAEVKKELSKFTVENPTTKQELDSKYNDLIKLLDRRDKVAERYKELTTVDGQTKLQKKINKAKEDIKKAAQTEAVADKVNKTVVDKEGSKSKVTTTTNGSLLMTNENGDSRLIDPKELADYEPYNEGPEVTITPKKVGETNTTTETTESPEVEIIPKQIKDEGTLKEESSEYTEENLKADIEKEQLRSANSNKIISKIKEIKDKLKSNRLEQQSNRDTLEYLETLLDEVNNNINGNLSSLDALLEKIKHHSKSKRISDLTKDVRNVINLYNSIKNRISELQESQKQLEEIESDLKNQTSYYHSLLKDKSLDTLSTDELKQHVAKLNKKLSALNKLIDNIKAAIRKLKGFLIDMTEYISGLQKRLEDKNKFYLGYKAYSAVENDLLRSLDITEFSEKEYENERNELNKVILKAIKLQNQIRYLNELIEPITQIVSSPIVPKTHKSNEIIDSIVDIQPTTNSIEEPSIETIPKKEVEESTTETVAEEPSTNVNNNPAIPSIGNSTEYRGVIIHHNNGVYDPIEDRQVPPSFRVFSENPIDESYSVDDPIGHKTPEEAFNSVKKQIDYLLDNAEQSTDESNSPDVDSNIEQHKELDKKAKGSLLSQLRRSAYSLFNRLTGNQMERMADYRSVGDPHSKLNPDPHQRRFFRFVTGNEVADKFKIKFMMAKEFYGSYFDAVKKNSRSDIDWNNLVIAVVIDKNGAYVGENGKPITNSHVTHGVYTTLSEASQFTLDNKKKYHSGRLSAEDSAEWDRVAQEQLDNFEPIREKLVTALNDGKTVTVDITGKNGGIDNWVEFDEFGREVKNSLKTISKSGKFDLRVIDSSIVSKQGVVRGFAERGNIIVEDDNGNVLPVQANYITEKDASLVADILIGYFINRVRDKIRAKGRNTFAASTKFVDVNGNKITYGQGQEYPVTEILRTYIPFVFNEKSDEGTFYPNKIIGDKDNYSATELMANGRKIVMNTEDNKLAHDIAFREDVKQELVQHLLGKGRTNGATKYGVNGNVLKGDRPFINIKEVIISEDGKVSIDYDSNDTSKEAYAEYLSGISEGEPRLYTQNVNESNTDQNTATTETYDPVTGLKSVERELRTPILNMNLEFDMNKLSENINKTAEDSGSKLGKRVRYRMAEPTTKQKEDLTKAIAWFKERFPNIDVNIVTGLIQGKSWGAVYKAAMFLSTEAEVGTTYHEAWHIVTQVFLTEEERQQLYKEYRKVTKDTTSTEDEIEEMLANEYMNYKLGATSKFVKSSGFISRIFRKIESTIRDLLGLKAIDIQHIFERIDVGFYKNKAIKNISLKRHDRVESLGDRGYAFTKAALSTMNSSFFSYFFDPGASSDVFNSLFDGEDNSEYLNEAYASMLQEFKDIVADNETPQHVRDNYKIIVDNFAQARKLHKNELLKFNIEIIGEDEEIDMISAERDVTKVWSDSKIKASVKSTASNRMQYLMGTITKQIKSKDDTNGDLYINPYGFYEVEEFGKVFGIIINTLSGCTTAKQMYLRLDELAKTEPAIGSVIRRLKIQLDDSGEVTSAKDMSTQEMSNFIDFVHTFSKNYYQYYMQITGKKGQGYIHNSTGNRVSDRIKSEWAGRVGMISKLDAYKNLYTSTKNGVLVYNADAWKRLKPVAIFKQTLDTGKQMSAMFVFNALGIKFENTDAFTTAQKSELTEIAKNILIQLRNTVNSSVAFNAITTSAISGYLNKVIAIEASVRSNPYENGHFNLDNELVYNIGLNSFVTSTINTINGVSTLEELYAELPWLRNENPYVNFSLIRDRLFDKDGNKIEGSGINFGFIEGSRERQSLEAEEFHKLKTPDKLAAKINFALTGKYVMLRPGDNKLERWFSIGKKVLFDRTSIQNGNHLIAMQSYLRDELNRSVELLHGDNPNEIAFKKVNAKRGILIDIITNVNNYKDDEGIVSKSYDSVPKDLQEVFDGNISVDEFIERHSFSLNRIFSKFISDEVSDVLKLCEDNKLVVPTSDGFLIKGLILKQLSEGKGFGTNLQFASKNTLMDYLKDYVVNNAIASIEQTKLFYGDPISYKSVIDQYKRQESANSTRKHTVVDKMFMDWYDKHFGGKTVYYGKHPVLRTATIDDIIVEADNIEDIKKVIKDKAKAYSEITEADGQGIISWEAYRKMLMANASWSFGKDSDEELYQWVTQKAMGVENPVYVDPVTKETRQIEKTPTHVIRPLKVVNSGVLAEDGYTRTLYKLSVYPLDPRLAAERNLAELAKSMHSKQIDIVVFASGNKYGYKTIDGKKKAQPTYLEDGSVNNDLITQDTYWKDWGIQVDIAPKRKTKVVLGTQMMKHIFNGVYNNGIASRLHDECEELRRVNAERITIGVSQLIQKLGLKMVTDDEGIFYEFDDIKRLRDSLTEEAIRRNMPDNVIEEISNLSSDTGIDTLISREKIENHLMSIADAMTTSQKVKGNNGVQVASTFFELSGIKREKVKNSEGKETEIYTSSDLAFYSRTEGGKEITRMQVLLPAHYKGQYVKGSPLNNIIGFRIPTQGMNSIEVIEVAGFLPEECGEMVVLPSAIVAKSGGDYDIDKLTMYFANTYFDKDGNEHYIKYGTDDELLKQYNNSTKEKSFEEFKKNSLENRMYELQAKIILHPDNYENLLTPNSTEDWKNTAAKIAWIKDGRRSLEGTTLDEWYKKHLDTANYSSILSTRFNMDISNKFQGGAIGVGVGALVSTFAIAAQMHGMYIANGVLNFKHNKGMFDDNILLGNQLNVKKKSISDLLSQFINLAVDAAKEPHMSIMGIGTHNLNIALYLTMAGVDNDVIGYFMSQPIIEDYYRMREINESQISEENVDFKYRSKENILAELRQKYAISGKYEVGELDADALEKMIGKSVDKMTVEEEAAQLKLLDDLLKYEETAKSLSAAVNAFGFDTKAGGKNIADLLVKEHMVKSIIEDGVIGNYAEALGVTTDEDGKLTEIPDSNAFMAPYFKAVMSLHKVFQPFTKFLSVEKLKRLTNYWIDVKMAELRGNNKYEDISKIITLLRQDLFTYLFMTDKINIDGSEMDISKEIKNLFYGNNSAADQLLKLKSGNSSLKNNLLIQSLIPQFPQDKYIFGTDVEAPRTIEFNGAKDDSFDVNLLTAAWEELLQHEFGMTLVKVAIAQTGFQNSPMSFWNLMPAEISRKILVELAGKIDAANIQTYNEQFPINNSSNKNLVMKKSSKWKRLYRFTIKEVGIPGGGKTEASLLKVIEKIDRFEDDKPVYVKIPSRMIGLQIYKIKLALKKYFRDDIIDGLGDMREEVIDYAAEDMKNEGVDNTPKVTKPEEKPVSLQKETSIDTTKEWKGDLESRPVFTKDGINTMRTSAAKPNEHFGNPFSEAGYAGTIKVSTIEDAAIAYKEWLLGVKYHDVKPEQRNWILNQINQGRLDNAKLLYAGKSERRGHGMHPIELIDVVKQLRSTKSTSEIESIKGEAGASEVLIIPKKTKSLESVKTEDLGMTVGEYMKTLDKTSRDILRDMINKNEIQFKCK